MRTSLLGSHVQHDFGTHQPPLSLPRSVHGVAAQVFTVRTPEDSAGVLEACTTATDIAIVGTVFIGMEAAVTLVGKFPVSRLAKGRGLSCGWLRPPKPPTNRSSDRRQCGLGGVSTPLCAPRSA
jgi:hypothetical protein